MEFKPTTLKEALKAKGVSMIVYGNPGVGKTSLIKTLVGGVWNEKDMKWAYTGKKYCEPEDILLITVDAGESVLDDPALHNMAVIILEEEVESLATFKGIVQRLRESCPWKWVFIDNMSELEKFFLMSLTKIKTLDVPRTKEWGDAAFYMRKYIRDLRGITKHGTNVIFIFWAMSVKDTDKDGVVEHTVMPMVMEKTSKEFVGLVEHTAYMGISEKSGKRYLQFDSNKLVFCKKRNDNLKQFEEANLGDIFRLLKGGKGE